ncbi:MAG TPA: alginate lyase family protein [Sphingomicrobium sp.]|nr:alginate lyase family protein [Sphingomicrobium sp.]
MLTRAKWYADRLRSMSAGEVVHRIGEQLKRQSWRNYDEGFAGFALGDGELPVIPGLRERFIGELDPDLESALRLEARKARSEPFTFLGATWPPHLRLDTGVPTAEAWLFDPVTGQPWEGAEAYCFSVPYRARRNRGDVKLVWELNRLQFLQPIAIEGARTGNTAETAAYVAAIVRSWMAANPPFRGINWNSGIELALRIVSISIATTALGAEAFAPEDRTLLRTFLNAHAFWLNRFESAHSSANNHLILESLGLLVLGLLCPDQPDAAKWEAKGRLALEREVTRQIFRDGVGAEQSPTYTSFTIEAYLLATLIAGAAGRPLDAAIRDRLVLAGTWLRWIMDEGGHVPEIGDNDAGRIIALRQEPERDYVASVLSCVSAMTGEAQLAPPRNVHHLRDLLFGRPSRPAAGPTGLHVFAMGGYSVWRGVLGRRKALLVFDHGPLGYLSIAAHGHADTLAVWLHLDDLPVLVDAGTYLYFGDPGWREYARSTSAHNTLAASSRSSSETAGPFNWRRKATGRLVEHTVADGEVRLVGEHDGYLALGLTHRRAVEVVPTEATIRISDALIGTGQSMTEIGLLLAPGLSVAPESQFVVTGDSGVLLRISGPAQLQSEMIVGGDQGPAGWTSTSFGSKTTATRVIWRGALAAGQTAITRLTIF